MRASIIGLGNPLAWIDIGTMNVPTNTRGRDAWRFQYRRRA
jgi:hypothetical protein